MVHQLAGAKSLPDTNSSNQQKSTSGEHTPHAVGGLEVDSPRRYGNSANGVRLQRWAKATEYGKSERQDPFQHSRVNSTHKEARK
jgi:hypothetical protein